MNLTSFDTRHVVVGISADIAGETRKALDALQTDPMHSKRFDDFVTAMVYGEKKAGFSKVVPVPTLTPDF
jgi:hypothetical protein